MTVRLTEAEEAYIEYCRTHGGAQTGIAGFRAGYEIGKALGREAASPEGLGVSQEDPKPIPRPNSKALPVGRGER